MDSMRSMQRSLPLSSSRRNVLLSDFRQTAQTLTTLYKNASAEIDRAYSEGAKEALELLLSAMDRENLGLQDGEGWRVRQMVLELYRGLGGEEDTTGPRVPSPPSEEMNEETKSEPNSSPVKIARDAQPTPSVAVNISQQSFEPPTREQPFKPYDDIETENTGTSIPQSDFTFNPTYFPSFDNTTDRGSQDDVYQKPVTARVTKPTLSVLSSYNPKVPGKSITITPLGPGAGIKRRTSPQAQRFLPSPYGTREGTKRTRLNGNDQ